MKTLEEARAEIETLCFELASFYHDPQRPYITKDRMDGVADKIWQASRQATLTEVMEKMPASGRMELINGVEGGALYLEDYRIAGPKPWGGGSIEKTWKDADVICRTKALQIIQSLIDKNV